MHVSETGVVKEAIAQHEGTYETIRQISLFGSPYLGDYENGADFREALGIYAKEVASWLVRLIPPLKSRLDYVSPQCGTYVYRVEF